MKLTRDKAWKVVRLWKRILKRRLKPIEKERLMVDQLLFEMNGRGQDRVPYGAIKKAVLAFAKAGSLFTVDDLMDSSYLPEGTTRKSLVSDLASLCRRGILRCTKPSQRGPGGSPKVYVIVKPDNKA